MRVHMTLDLSVFREKMQGQKVVLALHNTRAVRIGLNHGARYARTNYKHVSRTGNLVSPAMLRGHVVSSGIHESWGYLRNDAPYAMYVEYPTKKHEIRPINYWGRNGPTHTSGKKLKGKRVQNPTIGVGRGRALRFKIGGEIVFAGSVEHPGTPGFPFMVPASTFAGEVVARETKNVTIPALVRYWG